MVCIIQSYDDTVIKEAKDFLGPFQDFSTTFSDIIIT